MFQGIAVDRSPIAVQFVVMKLAVALTCCCFFFVDRDDEHKGKTDIPETKTGEEGSSKRNIVRKHDHDPHRKPKPQHGGGGGKGKWSDVGDGSAL